MGDHHQPERARSPVARRVLVAVGDSAFADLYRDALASAGWHVEVANDWRATQERLVNSLPDVLVLNTLRDLKQIDALEHIRSHPATRELPVILLTDTVQTVDLQRIHELGVLGLLTKSRATRETISETINRMLEQQRSQPSSTHGGGMSASRSTDSAE
jgi:CheY-like chemotaxis protein